MKILIIQLARFGDILQSHAAVLGLRHQHPSADIHVMVRSRFRDVTCVFEEANCIIPFPTSEFLDPLLDGTGIAAADAALDQWVESIRDLGYDRIVNLTFSPVSSYVTNALSREGTDVRGYTRYKDGFLALPCAMGRYFFAHVGIDKYNERSLREIFCRTAGVSEEHFTPLISSPAKRNMQEPIVELSRKKVALHVGASQNGKRWTYAAIAQFVSTLLEEFDGTVHLVGQEDANEWDEFVGSLTSEYRARIVNLVGRTPIRKLFSIVAEMDYVVGFDSLLMHVAYSTQTPSFLLSMGDSRYFESAPRVEGTSIYLVDHPDQSPSIPEIVQDLLFQIRGAAARKAVATWTHAGWNRRDAEEWTYKWIRDFLDYVYFDGAMPRTDWSPPFQQALAQLEELGSIARTQIVFLAQGGNRDVQNQILSRVVEAIEMVGTVAPLFQPIVDWVNARKVAVGPDLPTKVFEQFEIIYAELSSVARQLKREPLEERYEQQNERDQAG